ncbi:hypothetical protein Fmac_000103 [Flemingia macrophylla]|uniref:Knottin scorpion toxin-like domain-containing protein n=1 Tax=Flemingia macrophylla TaxID=520843 RepID=A0ABD1NDX2_9FABA
MGRFLKRFQVVATYLAIVVLVTSASEEKEPSAKCWSSSKTWPHAKCFHSSVCSEHCKTTDNAISGECRFYFKKCICKFCD